MYRIKHSFNEAYLDSEIKYLNEEFTIQNKILFLFWCDTKIKFSSRKEAEHKLKILNSKIPLKKNKPQFIDC